MKSPRRSAQRSSRAKSRQQHPTLGKFARKVLAEWRRLQLPIAGATATVGVSGGADSVALLLALDDLVKAKKLNIKIFIAHIDHRLRKTSGEDARWVRTLARERGYQISISRIDLKNRQDNLEQAARRARYKAFASLAQKHRATVVLTAHTMDDQAETILLNLMRGSGAEGLSGIESVRRLNENSATMLARPLLSWARRQDTEQFCGQRKIQFRNDEMNEDETFARVRVRRQLLPLMKTFNPRIVDAITRTGELLRADSNALNGAAERLLELSIQNSNKESQLRIDLIANAPAALRRRALRLWLELCRGNLRRLELVHIRALEKLATENRGARTIELPGGSSVTRNRGLLRFSGRTSAKSKA